jgi:16S rRNA processing protein RimM
MINKDNCILLGTLAKPHGTKGSLVIRFSGLKAEDIKKRGLVFVEIDGLPVPFFIESFQEKTEDSVILKIEGIDTETKAREFIGYPVYVMKEQVKLHPAHAKNTATIKGYQVTDIHLGFIGYAEEIIEMTNNPILSVLNEGREFLVPVHEDIILEIDDKRKVIRINAPEGLFDI